MSVNTLNTEIKALIIIVKTWKGKKKKHARAGRRTDNNTVLQEGIRVSNRRLVCFGFGGVVSQFC